MYSKNIKCDNCNDFRLGHLTAEKVAGEEEIRCYKCDSTVKIESPEELLKILESFTEDYSQRGQIEQLEYKVDKLMEIIAILLTDKRSKVVLKEMIDIHHNNDPFGVHN